MDAHTFANRMAVVFGYLYQIEKVSNPERMKDRNWTAVMNDVDDMHKFAQEAIVKLQSMDKEIADGVRNMQRRATDKGES